MRALRLQSWKSEPELVEVAEPVPGPGQVVVRIGGAGACHSDLHLMHDFDQGQLPWAPPFTLGHEIAGVVERPVQRGEEIVGILEADAETNEAIEAVAGQLRGSGEVFGHRLVVVHFRDQPVERQRITHDDGRGQHVSDVAGARLTRTRDTERQQRPGPHVLIADNRSVGM